MWPQIHAVQRLSWRLRLQVLQNILSCEGRASGRQTTLYKEFIGAHVLANSIALCCLGKRCRQTLLKSRLSCSAREVLRSMVKRNASSRHVDVGALLEKHENRVISKQEL